MGNTPQTQYREFKRETRNRSCKKSEAPDFSEASCLRPPAEFGDCDIDWFSNRRRCQSQQLGSGGSQLPISLDRVRTLMTVVPLKPCIFRTAARR
jgi:hypothetical protein